MSHDQFGRGDQPWTGMSAEAALASILDILKNGSIAVSGGGGGGSGTVTSVGATVPGILTISGSPITTAGTLAFELANQTGNSVFSSPSDGSSGLPLFRSFVNADLPDSGVLPQTVGSASIIPQITFNSKGVATFAGNFVAALAASQITSGIFNTALIPNLDASKITTGTIATARLGSGTANSSTFLRGDQTYAAPMVSLPVQTTFVDNVNGNDGTGVAGRIDKPFATISAAITATTAPVPIFIQASSTNYNEQIVLKHNVPLIFQKGAILNYTGSGGDTVSYPGTLNENYIILGQGQIISSNSTGGASAVSGGVTGSGYLMLIADVVAGQGANGNKAINFTAHNIDPNTASAATSRIDIRYVEMNHKSSAYGFDINYGGGPADIKVGNITNVSSTAGSRVFRLQTQTGLNTQNLGVEIDNLNDTAASGAVGQESVQLINSAGGPTVIYFKCDSIMVGNKGALNLGANVFVEARVIQNNSSSLQPVSGGSTSGGNAKVRGALIQNISTNASTVPLRNGHVYDGSILFEECRFENPGSTPSTSPMILVRDANSFDMFDDCVFYLASNDSNGLIDLETATAATWKGVNIIVRRAGSAPSIGSSATLAMRILGDIFANQDKASSVSVASGTFVFDSTITLANSIGQYFA